MKAKAHAFRSDTSWISRLRDALERSVPTYEESEHVEEQIYGGFPSPADQRRMDEFHGLPWPVRAPVIREFDDPRYRQIGIRLLAEHHPDGLGPDAQDRYQIWLQDRLETEEELPWLTRRAAMAELENERMKPHADTSRLIEIERYFSPPA